MDHKDALVFMICDDNELSAFDLPLVGLPARVGRRLMEEGES
jgi:hypothetical protein